MTTEPKKTLAILNRLYDLPEQTKTREGVEVTFPAYTVMQIMEPQKAKSDDWHDTAQKFLFTIKGKTFEFYTGIGHRECAVSFSREREEYKRLKNANLTDHGLKSFIKLSRATLPTIEDLFYSLVMDSSAADQTFSDWCSDFGYDTDSRKALQTYEACQESAVKMRGLTSSSLDDLRNYFQNF